MIWILCPVSDTCATLRNQRDPSLWQLTAHAIHRRIDSADTGCSHAARNQCRAATVGCRRTFQWLLRLRRPGCKQPRPPITDCFDGGQSVPPRAESPQLTESTPLQRHVLDLLEVAA